MRIANSGDQDGRTTHVTMFVLLYGSGPRIYVGEFSKGIEQEAAVARVRKQFGANLVGIHFAHYLGT